MPQRFTLNRALSQNLMWFAASLALAFFVWIVAIMQSDPVQEITFAQPIPILLEPDPGLVVTSISPRSATARVNIRAQASVLASLTRDDITVRADLSGLGEGVHVVSLSTQVTRHAVADPVPAQITVTLERVESRKVPVVPVILEGPNVEFEVVGDPTFDKNQVEVSGAVSSVSQVVAAQVALDLSEHRNPFTQEMRLVPVNADGQPVEGITLEAQTVSVAVNIRQRGDIRTVTVRPNILFETLPEGYSIASISYSPQTILVSGTQSELENLPATLDTQPIDLTNRTSDFEVSVSVRLPDPALLVIGGQTITVSVGITAPIGNRQFDSIPVSVIGVGEGLTAQISPADVSVVIIGPRPVLETLVVGDIQVVADLNSRGVGNHDLPLQVTVNHAQISAENVSVLPANVDVVIEAQAETTPEPPP